VKLRRLTQEGLRQFGEYLDELKTSPASAPPVQLLSDDTTSEPAAQIEVQPQPFHTRYEAGSSLFSVLEQTRLRDTARDIGLWGWLSLFYFDSVCPADGRGQRKPGERARHIPDASNFQRYYRHLLAGPWRIYRTHRDDPQRAAVVLCQPVHTPGDLVEQLASRQELVTNRALLAAATKLYVEPSTKQPKRGAGGKTRGTARRLADFFNQIDVTWDLYAMDAQELLGKLPREFGRFQKSA
jgi:hypothetical protein